jgi:hypothetical protein
MFTETSNSPPSNKSKKGGHRKTPSSWKLKFLVVCFLSSVTLSQAQDTALTGESGTEIEEYQDSSFIDSNTTENLE